MFERAHQLGSRAAKCWQAVDVKRLRQIEQEDAKRKLLFAELATSV